MYFPYELHTSPTTGSGVRPWRILEGFRAAGIDIEVISGTSRKRKDAIRELVATNLIDQFEWIYVELSTTPIALRDPGHVPRRPLLDARFWRKARSLGLPIGLFYRDVYWRFPLYKKVSFHKRLILIPFFHLEWQQVKRNVDHLFLPSTRMNQFLPKPWPDERVSALPPGGSIEETQPRRLDRTGEHLELLYVGGIAPPVYDLRPLFAAISLHPLVRLTVCCREPEWAEYAPYYKALLNNNIRIVHCSGDALRPLYTQSDAVSIIWEPNSYLEFAMPIKVFEAMGWGKPIITNAGTATAELVRTERVGWVVHDKEELFNLLTSLAQDRRKLQVVEERVRKVRLRHTWEQRAVEISTTLLSYRETRRRVNR